jgi:hypothetical protein
MANDSAQIVDPVTASAPESRGRTWLRRLVIGVSGAPLAVVSVLHAMGRSGDHGPLGRWWVLMALAVAGFFARGLIEKAIAWTFRSRAGDR